METDVLSKKIKQTYNRLVDKPNKVYGIFKDFFGEEFTDLQGLKSYEDFKNTIESKTVIGAFPRIARNCSSSFRDKAIKDLNNDEKEIFVTNINANCLYFDEVCNNYVGSDIYIMIYFPKVRVTNEFDKYIDISKLFVRVCIKTDGTIYGTFEMNRAEYSMAELRNDYMHSHIPGIPFGHFDDFLSPCLGEGPIISTIANLSREYDYDIWNLFCYELSKYVTVESISGVPYRRLELVGGCSSTSGFNMNAIRFERPYTRDVDLIRLLKDFIPYFINKKLLKFSFVDGSYRLGMSLLDYNILISNYFIEWYNEKFNTGEYHFSVEELKSNYIIKKCIIQGNTVRTEENRRLRRDYSQYEGATVCKFKGETIKLHITNTTNSEENVVYLLNSDISSYVLYTILKVINYRYGRNKSTVNSSKTSSEVRFRI